MNRVPLIYERQRLEMKDYAQDLVLSGDRGGLVDIMNLVRHNSTG